MSVKGGACVCTNIHVGGNKYETFFIKMLSAKRKLGAVNLYRQGKDDGMQQS